MAFNPVCNEGIPKGRIIPVYLTEDGDVYPIFFRSMEELELCGDMVAMALNRKVIVDNKNPINYTNEKISIINLNSNKN